MIITKKTHEYERIYETENSFGEYQIFKRDVYYLFGKYQIWKSKRFDIEDKSICEWISRHIG